MSQHTLLDDTKPTFWDDATKYALRSKDEPFVEEMAYCMVTLHQTGA